MAGERDFVNDKAVLSKMLELKPEYSLFAQLRQSTELERLSSIRSWRSDVGLRGAGMPNE